jgi:O-antigen ligase
MVLAISFLGVLLFALGMRRNPFISMGGLEYSLPSADYPRVESTFVHGSYLANYMAPSFFILAYLRFASGKTSAAARWFWTLTLLFVVIGFLTLSRSFLIWLAVVIPWAMWQNRTDALARTAAVVIALSILAFVALITAWVTFPLHFNIDRKEERLQINLNTKPSPRVEMWRQVWPEISKSPFWGRNLVQASGPAWVAGKYYPAGVAAHNTWLQLWATRGIFGLLSFMFFLAAAVKTGIKKPLTAEQKFLIPALISLLLISSIEHLVHPRFVYLLLGFFAGAGTRPKT